MVPTGSKVLDDFFGGYSDSLSSVYGQAGTGKTTLALLASLEQVRLKKKVLFIDTEDSFSVTRFDQLSQGKASILLDYVFLLRPKNFHEQHAMIKQLPSYLSSGKFSLVVVDTLTAHYRRFVSKEPDLAKAMLKMQLSILKKSGVSVFLTNQVYTTKENTIAAVGEYITRSYVDKTIKLELEPRMVVHGEKKLGFEIAVDGLKFGTTKMTSD